jgi:DNA-binding winged helix-turn-helix (wHTH) protein
MRYISGDCVLDTERYFLHRAGQPVRLRPKAFRLLTYLLAHRDRVVTKQELSEQVWQGQFISDATLESTLAAVRRALGSRGRDHRYIQTMHGHGYRFVALVEERAEPLPRAAGETRPAVAEAPAASQLDDLQTAAVATTLPSVGEHAHGSLLEEEAGAPLASQETPPLDREPSPGAGERKLVSVLCCALSLAPGPREPDDLDTLHQQVRALYNLSQREAQRYGGTVQPVVGERVLVVFGLPTAQEDHAQRAVLAALGLQQGLQGGTVTGDRTPTPWTSVRISVHTGPVAVGGLSADEAMALVVGETVTRP